MASAGTVGKPSGNKCFADKLPDDINEMKIKDEKSEKVGFSWTCLFTFVLYFPFVDIFFFFWWQEVEAAVADGNRTETGHIIVITIGGRKGQPKQVFEINC